MTGDRHEYRVRWQREGRKPTSQIYQTEKGAVAKRDRMVELDVDKKKPDGTSYEGEPMTHFLADMPDLVATPTIERRTVGEWRPL